MRIPKRIIQTAKSHDLPVLQKAAAVNLRLLNPDFEYLLFDDEQVRTFVHREFPDCREVFDSFPFNIQRYDFFRYLAVFRLGGFYFDTDVFLTSSLSELLGFGCVFPFEDLNMNPFLRGKYGMDWHIGNYAFGAAPGHPFLKAIIRNCVLAQKDLKWANPMMKHTTRALRREYQILNTTGPGLVSRTLAENQQIAESVSVLFPEDVNDYRTWHQFGSFGVHLMDGSWRRRRSLLINRILLFWEAIKMKHYAKESLKLGQTRPIRKQSHCSSNLCAATSEFPMGAK